MDEDDGVLAKVQTKQEVVAYLKKEPDKEFQLVKDPRGRERLEDNPDFSTIVFLGSVRWDSKKNGNRSPVRNQLRATLAGAVSDEGFLQELEHGTFLQTQGLDYRQQAFHEPTA